MSYVKRHNRCLLTVQWGGSRGDLRFRTPPNVYIEGKMRLVFIVAQMPLSKSMDPPRTSGTSV